MNFDWPAPTPPTAAVRATIERVATTVAIAVGLLNSGRALDMAGIDTLTGTLCAQVLYLSPALGAELRPALVNLDFKLSALEDAIRLQGPIHNE